MKIKIAITALIFFLAFWIGNEYVSTKTPEQTRVQIVEQQIITFTCAQGKSIWAVFKATSTALSLSDGRNIVLPTVSSASGARYANTNESVVFWNKGKTATLEEDGSITYEKCQME